MKVAFVSTFDATNPELNNGDGYYQSRALMENGVELDYLGPLTMKHAFRYGLRQAYYKYRHGRVHNRTREPEVVKDYARQIEQRLKAAPYDVVFSAISPGSQPIAYLDTDKPIVFWTDATFAGVLDSRLPKSLSQGKRKTNARKITAAPQIT